MTIFAFMLVDVISAEALENIVPFPIRKWGTERYPDIETDHQLALDSPRPLGLVDQTGVAGRPPRAQQRL